MTVGGLGVLTYVMKPWAPTT